MYIYIYIYYTCIYMYIHTCIYMYTCTYRCSACTRSHLLTSAGRVRRLRDPVPARRLRGNFSRNYVIGGPSKRWFPESGKDKGGLQIMMFTNFQLSNQLKLSAWSAQAAGSVIGCMSISCMCCTIIHYCQYPYC